MTSRWRVLAVVLAVLAPALTACGDSTSPAPPSPSDSADHGAAPPDLSLGESEPVADPFYPEFGNPDIDVLHYGLDLSYEPRTRTLRGSATLTIRPVVDGSELALDFAQPMDVSTVTVDGVVAPHDHQQYDLMIETAVESGAEVTVTIEYSGVPQRVPAPSERGDMSMGIGATTDPDTGALWSFQEPYGALTWYPVNDHPSDEALYDITLTVPDGYSGVASGSFVGQDGNTFLWTSKDPVASYLTTIAVDQYELTELTGPNDLPITLWTLPGYADFMPVLEQMPEMIEWLEQRYGPYPFDSAGVVLVGGESAMETQEIITFSGDFINTPGLGPDYVAGVLVHELAHQWFGNAVTLQDWSHLWLNEGAATYIEQMWNIDRGFAEEEDVVNGWTLDDGFLRADYGPPGAADPEAFAASNSYVCPALMLYHLRERLGGAEAVDEMLAAWVEAFNNQSATRDDFVEFVNQHTGEDLTSFIDEWLDSPHTPQR